MASNSHRKSDSSGRSTRRKRVHVGTGTASRTASAQPKPQLHGEVDSAARKRPKPKISSGDPAAGRSRAAAVREVSPKQAERERRRAQQRRRLLLRAVIAVAVVASIAALWRGISSSRLFTVENVEVTGVDHLSEQDVIDAARLPADATLLRFGEQRVLGRLGSDPWVADADIERRFPSTLVIEISERVPVALVDTGMTFWFVDTSGRVIAESVPDTATVLPVVRDVPDFTAEPGLISDSESLKNALQVIAGMGSEVISTVRVVTAPSAGETALLTAAGVEIMIGEATRLEEKTILVQDILRERGEQVVFIDVRSVERPISRGLE